jgi:mannitol/fructose-specific phosphotransferase system IIA component (Ntr-type)
MIKDAWLRPALVLLQVETTSPRQLVKAVAEAMAKAEGRDAAQVEVAFQEAMSGDGFSLGSGVAIPHTQIDEQETLVCLATTREPMLLPTIDGRPPDIFFFILSKQDPQSHLLLLAHLARLTRSRTFLDGLRRARTDNDVAALVEAAELRQGATLRKPETPLAAAPHALIVLSVSGEKLVDALLIDLVHHGFADACVLEAQSLREAATREVPLFSDFRDLFGDPGGRRVVLLEAPMAETSAIVGSVERVCEEHGGGDARISVIPADSFVVGAAVKPEGPGSD